MALFEGYERRIDQINAVLNSYGISSIEEAEKITKDAGLDVYEQVKKIQPLKKDVQEPLMLLQQSVKVFRHSVFQVLLLTTEK